MDPLPLSVLFITSPEYGQANVVLATAQEVASSQQFKVFVASYDSLRNRVLTINRKDERLAHAIEFVRIPGLSPGTTAQQQMGDTSKWAHPPGVMSAARSYKNVELLLMGDSPSEYMQTYNTCLQILKDIKPAAVVCDILMIAAHDAIKSLDLKFIMISPCSPKEDVGAAMSGLPMMLKWPMQSSGLAYPLRGLQKLQNIILFLCFAYSVLMGPTFARIRKARNAAGIKHKSPMYGLYDKRNLYLDPHLPEADWDELRHLPSNVVACGPIILPACQTDLDQASVLIRWLGQRPSVLINLGSLQTSLGKPSLPIAKGIAMILDSRQDLQILWKLKYDWQSDCEISSLLERFVDEGRLKVVPWLDVEPSTLLVKGHFSCSVHHGGANAFYEACKAGIPQVVLPIWYDTYEYAERVKYHRIGAIGNSGSAPLVEPRQFAKTLDQVLGDSDIRYRAAAIGAACEKRGEGREIAATAIKRWAQAQTTS